jgi:hypothetical protein
MINFLFLRAYVKSLKRKSVVSLCCRMGSKTENRSGGLEVRLFLDDNVELEAVVS